MSFDFLDIFLHLDKYLTFLVGQMGPWIYVLLGFIIFFESGFVLTPFLPGDSLLFAVGSLSALGGLDLTVLILVLTFAAIAGGFLNYFLGYKFAEIFFPQDKPSRYKKYLLQTHAFYQRHGGKTIVLARLIPIIRTFAPFVAGLAKMRFFTFALYNIMGGIAWICLFLLASFYFGQIDFIKQNFSCVILAIIIISIIPGLVEILRQRYLAQRDEN